MPQLHLSNGDNKYISFIGYMRIKGDRVLNTFPGTVTISDDDDDDEDEEDG